MQVQCIEHGEWAFKHSIAVQRWSFTGWVDVYSRRMPGNGRVRCQQPATNDHPSTECEATTQIMISVADNFMHRMAGYGGYYVSLNGCILPSV